MVTSCAASLLSINIQKRTCTERERERERERDLQAKPEKHGTVLISCVILCYLCLEDDLFRLATTQHDTTRDTDRQIELAQPFIMSADCAANTGWQPKHDT